ncbi:MAG: adenylate/guanylate cyclase domain-containing protein [Pseudomonadota bacterium]|nr:adenylate/guanylate cyclase domain-containing protein [Pseudomonadota bacterium]
MDDAVLSGLAFQVAEAGLAGESETSLFTGFCARAVAAGVPLARATVGIDTLHPIYEGVFRTWQRTSGETTSAVYGQPDDRQSATLLWQGSSFYHLLQTGESLLRRRPPAANEQEFNILPELRTMGMTDYVAIVNRISGDRVIGEMDCVYSSWATDLASGFTEADVAALRQLAPHLAVVIKAASLARIAGTLVETYLGRDAGRKVLGGRIVRGVADRIDAVLWFSDLRGFTHLADSAAPDQVIPLLNDYADVIVSAIHGSAGDVLKFMGDGVLAIFTAPDRARACSAALAAEGSARRGLAALNARRSADGLPVTDMYLGLGVGEVFYGNVGSQERLDFTVIGPAVNEVSRIADMCGSIDQPTLISAAFAAAAHADRERFVSVGRYALRGVRRPQELFTLDPGLPQ